MAGKRAMTVAARMSRAVRTVRPEDTLDRAASILWEEDCGCVPVVDGLDRVRGMLTDRDVTMAALTTGRSLDHLKVESSMARELHTAEPTEPLVGALARMAETQVRRLPVVDDEGHLVGLLSMADAAQAFGEGPRTGRKALAEALLAALVETTRPRHPAPEPTPEDRDLLPSATPAAPRKAKAAKRKAKTTKRKATKRKATKRKTASSSKQGAKAARAPRRKR
jgi:CBS domain-containing protein